MRSSREKLRVCLILLFVTVLGYWPVSFGLFSVKNDAIYYFLPFRYNISCAIQNGEFPFWSPFLYLGYPVHGDMQSGAWNPLVLFISLFTRYDVTLLHIELLFYIFLSGLGMHLLAKLITSRKNIRLFAAISFMLSGYMFSSGQFVTWIASTAFLPFVLYYYFLFLQTGEKNKAVKTAVFLWLLLVCGYAADLVYVFYIMLSMLVVAAFQNREMIVKSSLILKKYFIGHFLLIAIFLGLAAPALLSYFELLPYYERGAGLSYSETLLNEYELRNLISCIDPWPTWAQDFKSLTDPTGRNVFTGIATLCLFIFSLFRPLNRTTKFLLGLFVFSFFFSLGDGFLVRKISYYLLPGMARFRHPSHFRLFFIIPMILLATSGLKNLVEHGIPRKYFRWICYGLLALCLLTIYFSLDKKLTNNLAALEMTSFNSNGLKQWLYALPGSTLSMVGAGIQACFLITFLLLSKIKKYFTRSLILLNIVNLFIFHVLFPINFVSKTPPSTINALIHAVPQHADTSALYTPLSINSNDAFQYQQEIGLYYFYNKKVGISKVTNNPSFLKEQADFLNNDFLYRYISAKPVLFISDSTANIKDSSYLLRNACNYTVLTGQDPFTALHACGHETGKLSVVRFRYNSLEVGIQLDHPALLNLIQNYHHNWKARVDGHPVQIHQANGAFMVIPIEAGSHMVQWEYSPQMVYFGMAIFMLTLAGLILYAFIRKPNYSFQQ